MSSRRTCLPLALLLFSGAGSLASPAGGASLPPDFDEEEIVAPLDFPTAFAYAPDGRLFVAEKEGRVRVVSASGALLPTPFATVDVNTDNDRGLIGLALDPDFPTTPYVYLAYTTDIVPPNPINRLSRIHRITRMTANGDVALPGSEVVLIDGIPSDTDSHAGGALRFGPDGKLYVSTGDGSTYHGATSQALRALDIDQLVGKILRVNPDGSAPPDNPFYSGPEAVRSKVWQSGLRNPFKANFRPGTGRLYINDVGWDSWEEVNLGSPGASFGWPCFEGDAPEGEYTSLFGSLCASVLPVPPLYSYEHPPNLGGAITGGAFYEGSNYPLLYRDTYFVADYVLSRIQALTLTPEDSLVSSADFATGDTTFTPVDLTMGPDGNLVYLNLASNFTIPSGSVHRVVYVGAGNHAPQAVASATPTSGYAPLSVSFSNAGSIDRDGDSLSCHWQFGDGGESDTCLAEHVYGSGGPYVATLRLSDRTVTREAKVTITVGSLPPTALITEPPPYATFLDDDGVRFLGLAQDPDDGAIDPGSLRWTVILHHNEHQHDYLDATGPEGSFIAAGGAPGDIISYEVVLTATDSSGLSDTRSVTVRKNHPPIAVVGPTWTVGCALAAPTVTLDGSRSADADNQPFSYSWSQIGGPPVSLTRADTPFVSFQAPTLPGGAILTFRLEVDDSHEVSFATIDLSVPDLTDTDGDGGPACSDCAPFDSTLAAPAEAADLSIDSDEATISWTGVPNATGYDLDRGLITGPFVYDHACLGTDLGAPAFRDVESPPTGRAFYYVARAHNACGAGILGMASRGSAIEQTTCSGSQ